MKSLIRIILLSIFLLTFKMGKSQDSSIGSDTTIESESKLKRADIFYIGLNYYIPSYNHIKDIYGGGLIAGFGTEYWINDKSGIAFDFKFFSKAGHSLKYKLGDVEFDSPNCDIILIPFSATLNYRKSLNKKVLFGGPGIGYCYIKESIEGLVNNEVYEGSIKIRTLDLHLSGGIRYKPFYLNFNLSYFPYDGNNYGGIICGGGLFF